MRNCRLIPALLLLLPLLLLAACSDQRMRNAFCESDEIPGPEDGKKGWCTTKGVPNGPFFLLFAAKLEASRIGVTTST